MLAITTTTVTSGLNFLPAYPEIFLLIAAAAILLIDMFIKDARRDFTFRITFIVLLVAAGISAAFLAGGETWYTFNNMFVADSMANLLKVAILLGSATTLVYARDYVVERGIVGNNIDGNQGGEFYVLVLFSVIGQMIMVSANNLMSVYLGLELMSLSLYSMIALRRDNTASTESAMKYFILGALASGFLLYGMSMIYGATGTLDLSTLSKELDAGVANKMILVFGIVFIVAGLAFKLGVVPFHMWVPDVYQGAPTAVTLVIAGAPKVAAFAITVRILIEGLMALAVDWQQMLMILAVLSLLIGNLAAIAQTSIKRLLAYSTISHMGFLLLGLLSGVTNGNALSAGNAYSAALFYSLTYLLTTLAAFGVLLLISNKGVDADALDDMKGLHKRSPWAAFVMLAVMFSLAGIPPTVGFYAKFTILAALLDIGMVGVAIFAVMMSLIGAFYYLRVVRLMYFSDPDQTAPIEGRGSMKFLLGLNGLAVVLLGMFPGALMQLCLNVIALMRST